MEYYGIVEVFCPDRLVSKKIFNTAAAAFEESKLIKTPTRIVKLIVDCDIHNSITYNIDFKDKLKEEIKIEILRELSENLQKINK